MQPSERETRYRAIVESAVDFAIIATDVVGVITDWNAGATQILGWTRQEMLGQPMHRFFTPEDLASDRPAEEMKIATAVGRASDERWHLRKDGSRFWANGELMPLIADDGVQFGFVKILRDRTAEHEAAAAHRADAEFLRSVLASSGDCIKVLDLNANLTFMSEGGQKVMEVEDFGLIEGCFWPAFWTGAGTDMAKAAVEQARAGGVGHFRGPADTMKGSPRFWDVQVTPIFGKDGQPEKLLSISRDITDAHAAEDRARDVDRRWHDMFDRLAEGFILGELVRDNSGVVTDWRYIEVNPAWGALFGVDPTTAPGQTIREVFPGIEDSWVDEMRDVVETREPTQFTRKVGAPGRWYEGRAFPLVGDRFAVMFLEVTRQREADEQLRIREQEFHSLAQAIPNQVWIASPDGLLTWFNDQVYRSSGLTFEQLQGQGWAQIVHPDDLTGVAETWATALAAGEAYETEFRIRFADGAYRWHVARAIPSRAKDGQITRWVGTNTDIEDQKAAQVATAEDRDRLWTLAQDLLLVCDREGVIGAVNPTAERLLGWKVNEMVGHALTEFVHADDMLTTQAEIDKLEAGAETAMFESRYRTRGGDYRLLEWKVVRDHGRLHAVGRDVTEERRLARDRDRIWTLSPVLKVVGTMAGDITSVNPSWTSVLGWTAKDTIGHNIMEFVAPEDRDVGAAGMAQLAEGTPVVEFQNVFATKDGGRRRISWTTVPENGTLYGFGRDVTAETEAAAALATAEDALRQSQKMEAVGQLTGGIAHDFNNLLTGVSGNLELLQKRIETRRFTELERYIAGAQGAARRATALTHRLLAFSRRQTLEPKSTAVNDLINGMHDLIARTVGPEIEVEVIGGIGLWNTLVDRGQLENALLNLCINAKDAMSGAGKLTIETANRWLDKRTAADRDLQPGQYISLCVSDTGSGMSPATIAKVFEPFFTTKPIGLGTGLGLSMIYGFAKQSNGQVKIYSEVGRGTMVCLYLPRHNGDADRAETLGHSDDAPRSDEGETILIIDDEDSVRMLAVEILQDLGYTAVEAANGPAGLEILRSDARVDLLVTDVGLPGGLNGRQVAEAARLLRPDLKVLFITGYAENAVLSHGHLDPGMHILTKPFTMDDLARRVRELVAT